MKHKHAAVVALAAWLGVVGWVGAMIVAKPTAFGGYSADGDAAAAAELQQRILHNENTRAALAALRSVRGAASPAPLVAPAPSAAEIEAEALAAIEGAPGAPAPQARVLSMIISSNRLQQAVIDGELVARGAELADGSRVRAIGSNWVRLEDARGRATRLELRQPFTTPVEARP